MIKNIYLIIEDADALESFFECINYCSLNNGSIECTKACYSKHLEKSLPTDKY